MWPDLFIVGGGVSRRPEKFLPMVTLNTPIVPATLQNEAGIAGAAYLSAQDEAEVSLSGQALRKGGNPAGAELVRPHADKEAGYRSAQSLVILVQRLVLVLHLDLVGELRVI